MGWPLAVRGWPLALMPCPDPCSESPPTTAEEATACRSTIPGAASPDRSAYGLNLPASGSGGGFAAPSPAGCTAGSSDGTFFLFFFFFLAGCCFRCCAASSVAAICARIFSSCFVIFSSLSK